MENGLLEQLEILNQLYKEIDELYHNFAKHYGMSDSTFWILYAICEEENSCRQADLCEDWCFTRQTINSTLKKLEKDGLVLLAPVPGNLKEKQIILTEEGRRLAEKSVIPLKEAEQTTFGRLSGEERSAFLRLTRKYADLLNEESKRILERKAEKDG